MDTDTPSNLPCPSPRDPLAGPLGGLVLRGGIGGLLMGLANLVPGISGGTMLLAAGVYQAFVDAVADLSLLRFRRRSLTLLASVIFAAGLAIVIFAGPVKDLVVARRWIMYSLFIGLTLGGVPLVGRLIRAEMNAGCRRTGPVVGTVAGMAVMALVAFAPPGGGESSSGFLLLFIAGLAGACAMILPGISGGYLLLVLGQYLPILASIERVKIALSQQDLSALLAEWTVILPVGLGVLLGVAGISNLIRYLLRRFAGLTLGGLLGLLLGSVFGLWPFQQGVRPQTGMVFQGRILDATAVAQLKPEKWPLEYFPPSLGQLAGAALLIGLGLALTLFIARFGDRPASGDNENV